MLPPFHLIHGEHDKSVPLRVALAFAKAMKVLSCFAQYCLCNQASYYALHRAVEQFSSSLQAHDCAGTLTVLEGKSHTQLMIEDSLQGGPDRTVELILATVR